MRHGTHLPQVLSLIHILEGEGKLVPSCNNVVREGMVIRTNSPRALEARRVNMELILSQHDNKCATCIRRCV